MAEGGRILYPGPEGLGDCGMEGVVDNKEVVRNSEWKVWWARMRLCGEGGKEQRTVCQRRTNLLETAVLDTKG